MPCFTRLADDERGVAAIEFAIAAPIVILLLMTLFEMGFVLTAGIFLEAGARSAGRYGITGASRTGQTRDETIREIITRHVCPKALPGEASTLCFWSTEAGGEPLQIATAAYTDPRNVGVPEPFSDLAPVNGRYDAGEAYVDVNGNGQWDADMGVASAGGSGDIVLYTVAMPQAVISPLLRAAIGSSTFIHRTRLIVRNEPF